MEAILKTEDLAMRFGEQLLFSNANLTFDKGNTIALIGPNGTGKSTLLKIIAGIIRPTKGNVICNQELRLNYVPDRFPRLNLNMEELLTNTAVLDGLGDLESKKKLEYYYNLFQVKEMIHTPLKYLSKGTLQKVAVIQAFMGKSDILLLDEPLSGQDVVSQKYFIREVRELQKQGVTIILSCHEPYLVDKLADKVYEIKHQAWREKKTGSHDYGDNAVIVVEGYPDKLLQAWNPENSLVKGIREEDKTVLFCKDIEAQKILLQLLEAGFEISDYHMFGREEDYQYVKGIDETRE